MYFRKQICKLVDHTMSDYLVGGSVALEAQGLCPGYEPHDVDIFFPDDCEEDFKIWCTGMSVTYPSSCKSYYNDNHLKYDFIFKMKLNSMCSLLIRISFMKNKENIVRLTTSNLNTHLK